MAGSVGARLAASRRAHLVGRERELASLLEMLDDDDRVLTYVHGPGGVGKSSLLDALAVEVGHRDREVVWLDCADVEATVGGFEAALLDVVAEGAVAVVDRMEEAWELAPWFWRSLVPALPEGVRVVAAGRLPPPESWTTDAAFSAHATVLALRNLTADDATALARARGLTDDEDVAALVSMSRGHPLAIVVGTDVAGTATRPTTEPALLDHPDAVARLLGRFLERSITPNQREALHVCGRARRVDRALLARTLEVDDATADALLVWLRERPYAESHPDGLALHDLVRDALDHDLRWRDPEAFARLHLAIREVVTTRMAAAADGAEHERWARDLIHLNRGNPGAAGIFGFDDEEVVLARPVASDPEEHAWVVDAFGAESRSAAVAFWLDAQPEALTVLERSTGVRGGVALYARLDLAPDAAQHDEVAAWVLGELARRRPPEEGEAVLHQTLVVAGQDQERAVANRMATLALQAWRLRGLGWSVLSTVDEDRWAPTWTYVGYERLGTATSEGREVAVWARDFTRGPFAEWLAGMASVELDPTGTVPAPRAGPVALAREDFGSAVRTLLKDLHHPDRVRRSPLLQSRLAATREDPVLALRRHVEAAVALISLAPKQDVAARALDRTFLRPAGSQERAAELLGLPFSTYRRHLGTGIERLEALLWDWELHGPPADAGVEGELSRDRPGK